jgi:hypothetical protein
LTPLNAQVVTLAKALLHEKQLSVRTIRSFVIVRGTSIFDASREMLKRINRPGRPQAMSMADAEDAFVSLDRDAARTARGYCWWDSIQTK